MMVRNLRGTEAQNFIDMINRVSLYVLDLLNQP